MMIIIMIMMIMRGVGWWRGQDLNINLALSIGFVIDLKSAVLHRVVLNSVVGGLLISLAPVSAIYGGLLISLASFSAVVGGLNISLAPVGAVVGGLCIKWWAPARS